MKRRFSRDRLAGQTVRRAVEETAGPDDEYLEFSEELIESPAGPAGGGFLVITVAPAEAGRRLDALLAARFPEYSRSQLARLAKEGLILADGKPAKASLAATAGQALSFPRPEAPLTDLRPDSSVIISAIYEDEHILVVDKPQGLVVHPAPGHHGPTLAAGLLARNLALTGVGENFRPGLVHRLDKDTSGLLVTAKTEPALRALAESFSRRETVKNYLAFVKGFPPGPAGLIDKPIGRHQTQRHKMAAGQGREARTLYRVIRRFPLAGLSLVLLTLVTGRTHQARV
ncbi:RluA family pseudouridine synthase, partial [Deltaproteobacteria bacterium OttesenSCG-928-M10]|nr:RluA family pseudouridine synthase [Deltaproteobacteria bacterium OttesenSCG-928-M10]